MSNEPFSANPSGQPPTPGGPGQTPSGAYPSGAVPPAAPPPEASQYSAGTTPGVAPTDSTADGTTPVKPTAAERANSVVKKVVIGLVIAAALI